MPLTAPNRRRRQLPAVALLLLTATAATAQPQIFGPIAPPTESPALSPEDLVADERALGEQRADLERELAESGPRRGATIGERLQGLERLRLLLNQKKAALAEIQVASSDAETTAATLQRIREQGVDESPPYSLLEVDHLRDELDGAEKRLRRATDATDAAEAALVQARQMLTTREAARRKAQEALDKNDDPARFSALEDELAMRKLESRVAAAVVDLRILELRRDRINRNSRNQELDLLAARIERMQSSTGLDEEQYRERADRFANRIEELKEQLTEAERRAVRAEQAWSKALQRIDPDRPDDENLERAAARRQEYVTWQQTTRVLTERIQRLDDLMRVWERRFAVANRRASPDEQAQWRSDSGGLLDQYEREARVERAKLSDLRKEALLLNDKILGTELGSELRNALDRHQEAVDQRIEAQEINVASLDTAIRQHTRLLEELRGEQASRDLEERFAAAWAWTKRAWSYEVTVVDDQSITAGKLFLALVLLTLGLRLARLLSSTLSRQVLKRFGVPQSAASAFESITYYVAIVVVVLFALNTVSIPLTIFTLVGGALAIGIGFGSQNLVNNFISGLILLMERPISVGDLVDLDGTLGTIDRIGGRSTRLRTFENTHILIPNSFFLENRFINWTLSDDVIRGRVRVGVAYGSPTREVEKLLLQAADGVPHVERTPKPWVRFSDFGDNALVFDVLFYVRPLLNIWTVETQIRYRIDDLLREAGIVIAFPQRDIHLDAPGGLDLRISRAAPGKGEQQA